RTARRHQAQAFASARGDLEADVEQVCKPQDFDIAQRPLGSELLSNRLYRQQHAVARQHEGRAESVGELLFVLARNAWNAVEVLLAVKVRVAALSIVVVGDQMPELVGHSEEQARL